MSRTSSNLTIMFADISGSTRMFEELGNERATLAVTKITKWMAVLGETLGGRAVKHLGDGVLFAYTNPAMALNAAVQIQRRHAEHLSKWPAAYQVGVRMGVAYGEVIEVEGDTFGDAVNTAARLSDMAGPHQIWITSVLTDYLPDVVDYRLRNLGEVSLRGKAQPVAAVSVDWTQEIATSMLTVPASLGLIPNRDLRPSQIELNWLDLHMSFLAPTPPIEIGRQSGLAFVIPDQRVSRVHAVLSFENGVWSIEDVSTYGTWVRFTANQTEIALRRNSCVLHDQGELALGAPFDDVSAVTVAFSLSVSGGRLDTPSRKPRRPGGAA